jgi:hypothetical protein
MKNQRSSSSIFSFNQINGFAVVSVLSSLVFSPISNALEVGGAFHKGSDSGMVALSAHVTDVFQKGSPFHWSASYNYINGIDVDWNNNSRSFDTHTIDATFLYRHRIKSYSKFFQKVSIDFQAGLSVNLTESKFVWNDTDTPNIEDRIFSERGDINPVVAIAANYKIDKNKSVHIGVKHLPSFSEFKSISTVYAGFTYRFVNSFGY